MPDERLLVVRQGIDTGFMPGDPPTPPPPLRVLYLGQLSRHKGVDLLVSAVRTLQRDGAALELRLIGPLTDTSAFGDWLAGAAGDGVSVEAPQPRAALAEALHAAHVLVVPSRWYENSPNVILEAQAAGVPVVATGHGGMAEMVRHEQDGLLFAPGDAASLSTALRRLIDEPNLLARLRAGIVRPYGVEREMQAEDAALDAVLASVTRE
jgi:glycosyltransferase involved in cell wall biosynthesis